MVPQLIRPNSSGRWRQFSCLAAEHLGLAEGSADLSGRDGMSGGDKSGDAGAETLCGNGGADKHDRRESDGHGQLSAARGFGGCRRRQERTDGETHEEAAEVGGVADARNCGTVDQIIEDERTQAAEHAAIDLEMRRSFFQIHKRYERAGKTEDSAGRAGSSAEWMPINAGDAAEDAAGEVGEEIGEAAEQALGGAAEIPETPHVETEMNDAEMDEHAGDKAPPLAVERARTEVRAEGNGIGGSWVKERDAAEHHDNED